MNLHLLRDPATDEGTPGLLIGMDFTFHTLEKPWADNTPDLSCIPEGEYDLVWAHSDKFAKIFPECEPVGMCYHIINVPGREGILIHNGNREEQVEGCVLIGLNQGVMPDSHGKAVRAVLQSKEAIRQFHAHMMGEPAKLSIEWRLPRGDD